MAVSKKINTGYVMFLAIVSAMGGLLFGYDWVVIGGAKPFYERYFEIASSATLSGLCDEQCTIRLHYRCRSIRKYH